MNQLTKLRSDLFTFSELNSPRTNPFIYGAKRVSSILLSVNFV